MTKNIVIVAGEASGDMHGASLVRECKKLSNDLHFSGIGGNRMRAEGVDTLVDVSDLAVVGFIEVLAHFPSIYKSFRKIQHLLKTNPPDLLILIDYPGFNLRLAKFAKTLGIKVLFYISPQVWAWRQGRVKHIANVVDHMAVIFPFEVDFYKEHDVNVTYVGHPLTHEVKPSMNVADAQKYFNLNPNKKTVALLPGSRKGELQRLLPTMLDSARLLHKRHDDIQFILLQANTISNNLLSDFLKDNSLPLTIINHKNHDVMLVSDAIITASGTATLEAALMKTPMVVIYKIASFTAMLAKYLIKIDNISLCNIIAGEQVVPELLQENATPEKISLELEKMLYNQENRTMIIEKLTMIQNKMGIEDGSKNTAKLALSMI